MKKKIEPTASERYDVLYNDMKVQMEKLKTKIRAHANDQADSPRDWGFVGDMAYFLENIKRITEPEA